MGRLKQIPRLNILAGDIFFPSLGQGSGLRGQGGSYHSPVLVPHLGGCRSQTLQSYTPAEGMNVDSAVDPDTGAPLVKVRSIAPRRNGGTVCQ